MPLHTAPSELTEALADWLETVDFSSGEALGNSNQGEVRRFRFKNLDLAIKAPKGSGPAGWLSLQSLRREHRTYGRLNGLQGFPRCHGLYHNRYLVLDYIDGCGFRHAAPANREAFFAQLLDSIQAMHDQGVAHGDLKRKDNLRVDREGKPFIIDLGTAVLRKPGSAPVNRALFKFIAQTDLNAWVKLKHGRYHDLPAADQELLRRSWLERGLSRWWPGRR
ncbi:MAG: hypothetical protein V2J20_01155 [Wenzhouxiangella sp.]|jgi:serine/threonine protein kinase|nr:hypothetical protein [Wenzhouxiangella sp.]